MTDTHDPKGLIRDAYRIDGIGLAECRTIFLDWALGVPQGADPQLAVRQLLQNYAQEPPDHPMTKTLREAMDAPVTPRRRGGRSGRLL